MRILVITSCTGEKRNMEGGALTLEDFKGGAERLAAGEQRLVASMLPARDMYTGQQHVRLMRGVEYAQKKHRIDLHILSAGYGLIPGGTRIAPYEATFQTMTTRQVRGWAATLGVPDEFRRLMRMDYDLTLVLLGDDYLKACQFDASVFVACPTVVLCSGTMHKKLPHKAVHLHPVALANPEAKRFSCGVVSLKGELGARILRRLTDGLHGYELLANPPTSILAAVETP